MSRSDMLPFWTDAYLADTMHLTLEQHVAYLKLLMFAWRQEDCRVKNDNMILKNVLGVTGKKLSVLKPVLLTFFEEQDGFLTQKRLLVEAQKRRDWAKRNRKDESKVERQIELSCSRREQKSHETIAKNLNENNETTSIAVSPVLFYCSALLDVVSLSFIYRVHQTNSPLLFIK